MAASTAQLLVACNVKADMDSQARRRLQAAGHAVKVVSFSPFTLSEDSETLFFAKRGSPRSLIK